MKLFCQCLKLILFWWTFFRDRTTTSSLVEFPSTLFRLFVLFSFFFVSFLFLFCFFFVSFSDFFLCSSLISSLTPKIDWDGILFCIFKEKNRLLRNAVSIESKSELWLGEFQQINKRQNGFCYNCRLWLSIHWKEPIPESFLLTDTLSFFLLTKHPIVKKKIRTKAF